MSGSLDIQGSMRSRGSLRREPFRATASRPVGGGTDKGCFRPRHSSASQKTCLCSLQARKLAAETSRRLKPARTSRHLGKAVALVAGLTSSKPSALLEGAPSSQRVSRGPRFLRSGFRGDPLLRVCGELMATAGRRKGRGSALACSCSVDLASNMFTFGTAMVVPFYTLMLAAPKWRGTRKVMDSAIPYVILGAMYMYLLSISWTPEHPKLMFSSKYWLPELSGITRMFSSMLTVSSAWIHLLAVDLFAGRNIYLDSITHNLPSRHSLVLCLMFGPVGIFSHLFTKNIVMAWRKATKTEKDNRASEAGPINVFPNEPFAGSGHHEPTVDGVRPSKARGT